MKVLITGANGFVGQGLAKRLLKQPLKGQEVSALTLLSRKFEDPPEDDRVRLVKGDLADSGTLDKGLSGEPDVIFHLACVPGGVTESNFDLGKHINLDGAIELLERLRLRNWQNQNVPTLVFTSSIAVYGHPLPAVVDESLHPRPELSYGAMKLATEVLIADYSRRGWLDGRSVRLPGIMSRPQDEAGHTSRFLSDLIRDPAEGRKFTCPAEPQATSWFLSRSACIDNLINAAEIPDNKLNVQRQWQLPAQHLSLAAVVDGLAEVYGEQVRPLISWQPDSAIQGIYASYPPLETPEAFDAGFRHDGDVQSLVKRALEEE